MFEAAADLLDSLAANESTNTDLTWARQAACARELGDLDKSAELFEKVVAVRAGDIDSALELAQIYMELGDNEQAMRVVTQVEEAAATQTAANDDASQAGKALIESGPTDTKASQREQAKRAEEEQAQLVNRASFQRCKLLWASWNESAATEAEHGDLLRTARKLIQKFQTTKAFYPSDRVRGFYSSYEHRVVN